jgi:hypothetical protein
MKLETDPFGIRTCAQGVMQKASHVRISLQSIEKWVDTLEKDFKTPEWDLSLHFFDGTEKTVNWLFALDAVNFSFWPDEGKEKWRIFYHGKILDGYQALAGSFKRAVEEGFALWNPFFLATLSKPRLRFILRGKGEIPLFFERLSNLRETGEILLKKFGGDAVNLINHAKGSSVNFVKLVVENFPSFQDVSSYQGIRVPFYKRAQLLASDLYTAFGGKSFGSFVDMQVLTAFADYKIPQILRALNILIYDEHLAKMVDTKTPLPHGSPEEVEIRAATIHAVEEICLVFQSKGRKVFPFQVDAWLWQASQAFSKEVKPYHRTRTIYY